MAAPQWLGWVQRLQAIAQIGLAFSTDPYDRERYEQIRELAVEMAAAQTETAPELIRGLFNAQQGYSTPKVDVRGAVIHEGRLLLVREATDGRWSLPGGWADVWDAPSQAVAREIAEESGYEAQARKLVAVYDRARHPHPPHPFAVYKLFFLCELNGGAARSSHETPEVGWFAPDALPELSTGRVHAGQIARCFAHHADPHLPTEFD